MKNPFISHREKIVKKVYKHPFHPDSTRLNRRPPMVEPQALPDFKTWPTPNELLMLNEMVELRKKVAVMEKVHAERFDFTPNTGLTRMVYPQDLYDYVAAQWAIHHTTRAFRDKVNCHNVYQSIQDAMRSGTWVQIVSKANWVRDNAQWKHAPLVADFEPEPVKPVFKLVGGLALTSLSRESPLEGLHLSRPVRSMGH